MNQLAILIGTVISFLSKTFGLGAGATWPGEIALQISPNILSHLIKRVKKGAIFVIGTNGKTTTSLMIKTILSKQGLRVLHNDSGANLLNGIVSTFLQMNRMGKRYDIAVFEIDENAFPIVATYVDPTMIVMLNIFRDQLDRYGEVDVITEKWEQTLKKYSKSTTLIANADDVEIAYRSMQSGLPVHYFGMEKEDAYIQKMAHAVDSIYCPRCNHRLTFGGVYYSHLGKWTCGKCGLMHPVVSITGKDVISPIEGIYNVYNAMAASLVALQLGYSKLLIAEALETFTPAFGRMEELEIAGKKVKILLSKNPTSVNESIRTILSTQEKGPVVMVLNDRIPDGTDVSWIWDVDIESLSTYDRPIIVSGDRAYDLAVRLQYAEISKCTVEQDVDKAVLDALLEIKEKECIWIIATYSGMLDVRKILTGKKIL